MINYMSKYPVNLIDKNELVLINYDYVPHIKNHSHEFYEISYILRGHLTQNINGVEYNGIKGDVFFFGIEDSHSYDSNTECDILNCILHPDLIQKFIFEAEIDLDPSKISRKISLSYFEMIEFEDICLKLEKEIQSKQLGYINTLKNYAFILLTHLLRYSQNMHLYNKSDFLDRILLFIEENCVSTSPAEIAEKFKYNHNYLCKIFKEKTGLTMIKYITRKRINKAFLLLKNTDDSIDNIAQSVGIPDKKNFYSIFKTQVGLTPKEYRKRIKMEKISPK